MLTRSLCCFRGVSVAAERKLWRAGCLTWDYLPQTRRALSPRKAADLAAQMPELRAALEGRVADYFLKRLPIGHRLRVWPDFADGMAFLDVETTGLGPRDELTVIGMYQAGRMLSFARGRNLCEFLGVLRNIDVLVTFNGTRFDLPMLARTFDITCLPPHIDLMHEARAYGYMGGLKSIERSLGIRRTATEEGDGEMAVRLWRNHVDKIDNSSFERLLQYNARDVRSLVVLSNKIFRQSFADYPGPLPAIPSRAWGMA